MNIAEEILAKLDKDTLSKLKIASKISHQYLPTPSIGINQMLGGGLRLGKQHTFYGGEQSGKSSFLLQTVGLNQRALGTPCAWIDAEHCFDPQWAKKLGVDIDSLIVTQASTISEVNDLQIKLIRAGVELIVIDSTSSLMPKSFFDKGGEMKNFDDSGQIGQFAKDLGQMCRMVQGVNFSCAVVHISQVRMDLGNSFMPGTKASGGKEVEHTDSFRIRLTAPKSENEALKSEVVRNNKVFEEIVGRKVNWLIKKNKINGLYGSGMYHLYTQGDLLGLDEAEEILRYAQKYGIVETSGNWINIFGRKINGVPKAAESLRENPQEMEKIRLELMECLR